MTDRVVMVKSNDEVKFAIRFDGILGGDLATVAGRERLRRMMELRAAEEIETFFATVECGPAK